MKKIVIETSGGTIDNVYADDDAEVVILDKDEDDVTDLVIEYEISGLKQVY